jgi:MYXO-CTERM domain-containing protein
MLGPGQCSQPGREQEALSARPLALGLIGLGGLLLVRGRRRLAVAA